MVPLLIHGLLAQIMTPAIMIQMTTTLKKNNYVKTDNLRFDK